MLIPIDDLVPILSQFNPWWRHEAIPDLPVWRRSAFDELITWIQHPPAPRAVLLSGARQIGKTTLMLQVIDQLLKDGVPAANILYVTFDHPLFKLAGIDAVLDAWRTREPKAPGPEYVFLDEAQFIRDWGTWIKHQVDFTKNRRVTFTGSAIPLIESNQESGVGRWHTIKLTTLSFYEYLKLKQASLPALPKVASLDDIFEWTQPQLFRASESAIQYTGLFHEYLVRGGFPQTAQIESITQAQRLLREDIIDKVLKRDMTALFGVRRVLDLEHLFLYVCMHDGQLLDMPNLCTNLEVKRPTAQNFIELLESVHLIYRLPPFGYGKDVLRARFKIYLADAAIAPAVLLKGKSMLEDPTALGVATETAVFKHLMTGYQQHNVHLSYWRGKQNREVDVVAEFDGRIVPFEIKYRTTHTEAGDLKGLLELCQAKSIPRAVVVTKSANDFSIVNAIPNTQLLKIPAPLLCYWLGAI